MSITQGLCYAAKQAFLKGEHLAADSYKLALYTSAATLDPTTTTVYTASDEVASGGGYTTGGQLLTGYTCGITGGTAYLDWDNAVWAAATFTARGALLYNSTTNAAIAIYDFGSDMAITANTFTAVIPGSGDGIVWFG